MTYSAEYTAEKRGIWICEKEPLDAIRLRQSAKSAVADHVHDYIVRHNIDLIHLQVLDRAGQRMESKIRVASDIYQREPVMNRDTGVE